MIMMFRPVAGLFFVTIALSVSAASWDDDSHYVSLGPRNGYYIVQPDSKLFSQLGLWEAPIIDTSDPLRHGYGADALAFPVQSKRRLDCASCLHRAGVALRFLYAPNRLVHSRPSDYARCGGDVWPQSYSRQSP